MAKKMGVLWMLLGLLGSVGCHRSQPVDFGANEYKCDFCGMLITQSPFKTEILSPKGKIYRFDSIECMVQWSEQHAEQVESRWVTDFFHPNQWIRFEKAFFLRSEKLPSPMGAFLSAHASAEALEKAQQTFGGEAIAPNQLAQVLSSKNQ